MSPQNDKIENSFASTKCSYVTHLNSFFVSARLRNLLVENTEPRRHRVYRGSELA